MMNEDGLPVFIGRMGRTIPHVKRTGQVFRKKTQIVLDIALKNNATSAHVKRRGQLFSENKSTNGS